MSPGQHTVLITGGATGIGFAIAHKFCHHGNRVIIVSRSECSLRKAICALPNAEACMADITIHTDRERLVAAYPDTTILINSAGILENSLLSESSPQAIERELAVNLLAPIVMSRLFLPKFFQAASAAIINISSSLAIVPKERAAVYSASKAALHIFSKALRWQLEGTCIRVFEVLPPLVDTPMTTAFKKKKMTPSQFADRFWDGFLADQFEMPIGNARLLSTINRLAPSVAELIMRKTE